MGADVSDSQLLGACDNLKAAGLADKIDLLQGSVTGKIIKKKTRATLCAGFLAHALWEVCGANVCFTSTIVVV